tara:strand:- start:153 stop:308 length:156 start_codon:yes stop_codon:yes gene_type:complete
MTKINSTLTKNMPNVKWNEIPPVKGPNPQGTQEAIKPRRFKSILTISRKKN